MSGSIGRAKAPNEIRKLNVRQIAQIRALIPIGRVVRRLSGFAVGDWERVRVATDDGVETYEERPIDMNANQVRAAVALLNKMIPDLQSVQLEVTDNRMEDMTTDELKKEFRRIVTQSGVIDVDATVVSKDLLELPVSPGEDDLLAL